MQIVKLMCVKHEIFKYQYAHLHIACVIFRGEIAIKTQFRFELIQPHKCSVICAKGRLLGNVCFAGSLCDERSNFGMRGGMGVVADEPDRLSPGEPEPPETKKS